MAETTRVRALRAVRVAVAGSLFGRELAPGDEAEISADLVEGLVVGGFVETVAAAPPSAPAEDEALTAEAAAEEATAEDDAAPTKRGKKRG